MNPIIEVKLAVAATNPSLLFFLVDLVEREDISQKVQTKRRIEFQTHHQTVKNSHSEWKGDLFHLFP